MRSQNLSIQFLRALAVEVNLDITGEDQDVLAELAETVGFNPLAMRLALKSVRTGKMSELREVVAQLKGQQLGSGVEQIFEQLFEHAWGSLRESATLILRTTPLFVGMSSIGMEALQAAAGLTKARPNLE